MSRAIIVGGSRGIGFAIAKKFVKNNIDVSLVSRNESNLIEAVKSLEKISQHKVSINYQICDVSNENDIEKCCRNLLSDSHADILVNSAGITQNKLLLSASAEEIRSVLNTNLLGSIHFSKLISKSMIRKKKGSIVNVGSVIGSNGNVGQSIYAASKSGLVGLTKSLAKELGPKGITVNLVAPGFINTDMTENIDEKRLEDIRKLIPVGRIGNSNEVANVVHFLACESTFITGLVMPVDGGLTLTM